MLARSISSAAFRGGASAFCADQKAGEDVRGEAEKDDRVSAISPNGVAPGGPVGLLGGLGLGLAPPAPD